MVDASTMIGDPDHAGRHGDHPGFKVSYGFASAVRIFK